MAGGVKKIIMYGESSAGKTSILQRCVHDHFDANCPPTIGVDFLVTSVRVDVDTQKSPIDVRIQLWDTSGRRRFFGVVEMYSSRMDGMLLVYDVTNARSFEQILEAWAPIRDRNTRGCPTILVGTKSDSEAIAVESREVTFEQGQQMAHRIGAKFMEVSAKSGLNCRQLLTELVTDILAPRPPSKWGWLRSLSFGWTNCFRPAAA
mmetsp:Transcript_6188/g.15906  ORF Transcript_6188/g.15906 Transcript_6188/m.15906 type:complete len:205 (+) Transcript_6188:331-945(+)